MIEEVDCYSADAAEGLEYTRDLPTLEPLAQIKWDWLGNDGVPALLVYPNAFLEPGEEVVTLIEIPIELLGNAIPFLHRDSAVIVASELKVFGNYLEIAAEL